MPAAFPFDISADDIALHGKADEIRLPRLDFSARNNKATVGHTFRDKGRSVAFAEGLIETIRPRRSVPCVRPAGIRLRQTVFIDLRRLCAFAVEVERLEFSGTLQFGETVGGECGRTFEKRRDL